MSARALTPDEREAWRRDGFVLRRGDNVIDALELQFGFVAAMARVGGMRAE